MLKSYFISAIRNLQRNLTISLVNIIGLALGIAVTLTALLYVQFEKSFDKYHKDYKQIFRVYKTINNPDWGAVNNARIGGAFYNVALSDLPCLESITRVVYLNDLYIRNNKEDFKESKIIFADSTFFKVFTFPLIEGDPENALKEPNSVVITEATANKYFGNENALGKTIGEKFPLKVTGILKKIPENSHFRFNMVASLGTIKSFLPSFDLKSELDSWESGEIYTYIKLKNSSDEKIFREAIDSGFVKKYIDVGDNKDYKLNIEPLEQIHLNSRCEFFIGGDLGLKGNEQSGQLYIFSILSILILVIACINFTNISVSCSLKRSKEVALRKVNGANRPDLIRQFISEHVIITFIALNIAVILVELFLPSLGNVMGRRMSVDYLHNYIWLITAIIILVVVGVSSGIYPAFILSAFSPIKTLSNNIKINKGGVLKKLLIITQFTVSIFLIILALFCKKQLDKWTSNQKGYDIENMLMVELRDEATKDKYDILKNEILKSPDITGITSASINFSTNEPIIFRMKSDEKKDIPVSFISVDESFISTFALKIDKGRDITGSLPDNKTCFIIDETAKKLLDYSDPVDRQIELLQGDKNNLVPYAKGKIVGVIKNFNYLPGYKSSDQKGLIINIDKERTAYMFIKVKAEKKKAAIQYIRDIYDRVLPQEPLVLTDLKDDISNNIVMRYMKKTIFYLTVAPILATIIALMGMLALIMQTVQRRTKEIAIRKVYGTPVSRLLLIFTKEYSVLVLTANILAIVMAYPLINFLARGNSSFKGLDISVYIIISVSAYITGMLCIVSLIIHTIRKNPAEALKYE